jgi:pimeloyl-ACP methyl ester carboxylesterase
LKYFYRQTGRMKLAQKLAISYIRAKLNIMAMISKEKAAKKAFDIFCTPFRKSKKKTPALFEKAESLSFLLDDHVIRGYRWNAGGTKKILIVHGFESSAKNFDRYITPLIKKGYEVMAFDAPAHGKSGGKRINLPLYIQTITKVAELYGPIDGFITHSFGGLAATHYLETVAHNDDTRLVLIAPATETTSAIDSFFNFLKLSTDIRKEFDQLIYEKGGVWPDHYSIRRAMKNVKAKVLWFHDENDDMTPLEDALNVANDNHPNLEFVITQGLGHRRIYRDNSVMKRIFEFL